METGSPWVPKERCNRDRPSRDGQKGRPGRDGRKDKGNEMIRTNDKGGRDGEGKGMGKDQGGIMKGRCLVDATIDPGSKR